MKTAKVRFYSKFAVLSGLAAIGILFQNCSSNFRAATGATGQVADMETNTTIHSDANPVGSDGSQNAGSAAPSVIQSDVCQSETFCVHDKMPLWSQADGSKSGVLINGSVVTETLNVNGSQVPLLKYVQDKGYAVQRDPGWCGATSMAMILKSFDLELHARDGSKLSEYSWIGSSEASEVIFESMGILGMNPLLGATNPDSIRGAFSKIKTAHGVGSVVSDDNMISRSDFRDTYKKPLVALAIGSKLGGAHIVALNGTDGQYYVIYDPWGSSYSVSAKVGSVVSQTLPPDNKVFSFTEYFLTYIGSGIKTLNGVTTGFIPSYGTTGKLTSIRYQDY